MSQEGEEGQARPWATDDQTFAALGRLLWRPIDEQAGVGAVLLAGGLIEARLVELYRLAGSVGTFQ